jgi:hypothetical protein
VLPLISSLPMVNDHVTHTEDKYSTRAIVDHSLDFLKEHRARTPDKPFFLYLDFTAPHFPPQADIDLYEGCFQEGWDSIRNKRNANLKKLGVLDAELSDLMPDLRNHWSFPDDRLRKHFGSGEGYGAVPWDTLPAEAKRFQAEKMAIHAAMVHRLDRETGRLIEQLRNSLNLSAGGSVGMTACLRCYNYPNHLPFHPTPLSRANRFNLSRLFFDHGRRRRRRGTKVWLEHSTLKGTINANES